MIKERPDFVFICSDQHAARWSGFDGNPVVRTPHLDRIAERGVVFERAYCLSPMCAPSRAALMTGALPSDCHSFCNSTPWNGSRPTWGRLLQNAGYRCLGTGKLDLNDGFDLGFEGKALKNGHVRKPDVTSLFRRTCASRLAYRQLVDGEAREDRLEATVQENALALLEEALAGNEQPWALYIGFNRPHPKFTGLRPLYEHYLAGGVPLPRVREEELETMHPVYQELRHFHGIATPIGEERIRRARAAYFATVTELDDDIGRIWSELERRNALEKTIFVYTSDHGETLGEHGQWLKTSLWDESIRVPLLLAGGGLPGGKRVRHPVSHLDLVATIADLAGAAASGLRGASLRDLIAGQSDASRFAYSESHNAGLSTGAFMIAKGSWKYTEFAFYPEGLLFNLDEDPYEEHNRFNDPSCVEVLDDLRACLRQVVDPEQATEAAFAAQAEKLRDLTVERTEAEVIALLESRLGKGQARSIARWLAKV